MKEDIRWKQRFENFKKAFNQLKNAINQYKSVGLNELEKQGLIQSFEYTFELGWNLLRDYLIYQGITDIRGSRDAIKTAFKYGLIQDGENWIKMITARNLTSHTYNENIIEELIEDIVNIYFKLFEDLLERFSYLYNAND
ncbi:nucleotidyltransferase substrate binding protein [Venenivibrio stagnispumantis]|uniref:Nucleotidyltransferase substrate binding protein, HI0074 family n=1 Tax=Venenivibrio stagnispumantis TaxID=407998 RepID=A0AA45WKC8_9AQUI|nr:nucleotidyltransferase substrate binding protein [Venenivibrio stagnispumantis]MCW4573514.1 nucleotidyltransferase substrate binding protein [Venenivibrio stagnispumantis]SMP06235.1 nucleotidyltransferase substrate binding protein, HI0074 family [Venenivibrio stagnispumantis]